MCLCLSDIDNLSVGRRKRERGGCVRVVVIERIRPIERERERSNIYTQRGREQNRVWIIKEALSANKKRCAIKNWNIRERSLEKFYEDNKVSERMKQYMRER